MGENQEAGAGGPEKKEDKKKVKRRKSRVRVGKEQKGRLDRAWVNQGK